jgi:hypothetical protein
MIEGTKFTRRGQQYECVGGFEHEIPARLVWIHELHSPCADCGRGFWLTASIGQINNRQLSRRCERCAAPGRSVVVPLPRKQKTDRRRKGRKRKGPRTVRSTAIPLARIDEAPKPAIVSAATAEQAAIGDTYQRALGLLI